MLITLIVLNVSGLEEVDVFVENTGLISGLFILHVLAQLPWCYCFSYLYKEAATALMWTNMANIILVQALLITQIILGFLVKLTKIYFDVQNLSIKNFKLK